MVKQGILKETDTLLLKDMPMFFIRTLLLISLIFIWTLPTFAAKSPKSIAGFTLGLPVTACKQKLYPDYLLEKTVLLDVPFRKGYIYYGNCKHKDKILKLKVKYADKSKKFFKHLYAKLAQKYDDPGKWEGDSFGILAIHKWQFIDEAGHRVTLAIEYNSKDEELSMGTVLKISYPVMIEEERICALREQKKFVPEKRVPSSNIWDDLLPQ